MVRVFEEERPMVKGKSHSLSSLSPNSSTPRTEEVAGTRAFSGGGEVIEILL